jgi:hypothetical protein
MEAPQNNAVFYAASPLLHQDAAFINVYIKEQLSTPYVKLEHAITSPDAETAKLIRRGSSRPYVVYLYIYALDLPCLPTDSYRSKTTGSLPVKDA